MLSRKFALRAAAELFERSLRPGATPDEINGGRSGLKMLRDHADASEIYEPPLNASTKHKSLKAVVIAADRYNVPPLDWI